MTPKAETWERVAREVSPGWAVVHFNETSGEIGGTITEQARLDGSMLRIPVAWSRAGREFQEVIDVPIIQRTVAFVDSNVLISGVHGTWVLTPKAVATAVPRRR